MNPKASQATLTPVAGGTAIGVDLGGTKIAAGVVDAERRVHDRRLEPSCGLSATELMGTIETIVVDAIAEHPDAVAVGLGLPCAIDYERGVAVNAVNLPIADLPIRDILSEKAGLPVFLDNDANVAALAEHRFGAATGARSAVMLTIGTGVGGGVIIDGELFRATGSAPELGHLVIDADGPGCQGSCPNRGCIEALASGTALGREGLQAASEHPESALGRALAEGDSVDGPLVLRAAMDGDEVARDVFALIGRRLGVAITSLANVFAPDVFVIGGGVAAAGELLLGPAREELRSRALPPQNTTAVVNAQLGPDAGLIGAALMAREAVST